MKLDSLEPMYMGTLKDLYDAEKQIVEALPKMASAASLVNLKEEDAGLLEETIEEEDVRDAELTEIAETIVNSEAGGTAEGEEEDEEEEEEDDMEEEDDDEDDEGDDEDSEEDDLEEEEEEPAELGADARETDTEEMDVRQEKNTTQKAALSGSSRKRKN